jgi:hypothetical protein
MDQASEAARNTTEANFRNRASGGSKYPRKSSPPVTELEADGDRDDQPSAIQIWN